VDKSTERILKIKYDLGLFTNPYASNLSNPNIATVRLHTYPSFLLLWFLISLFF
jgi:beta-glucosidase-like glycosyl hydrolase